MLREQISPKQGKRSKVDTIKLLPSVFVVVDLETTGLGAEHHEIIEIGAIRVTLGAYEHDTFQVLVKPSGRLPQRITRLTGITQTMIDVKGASIHEAMSKFSAFIQDAPLVTYNASFDMPFSGTLRGRPGYRSRTGTPAPFREHGVPILT